jgi:hypothetical protein
MRALYPDRRVRGMGDPEAKEILKRYSRISRKKKRKEKKKAQLSSKKKKKKIGTASSPFHLTLSRHLCTRRSSCQRSRME